MSNDPNASAIRLDGADGERVGARAEIAEGKLDKETLREEGVFRALAEQEIAGVYIIAADGTVAYVNPYFAQVLGYQPAEVVGRPLMEFIAEPDKAAVTDRFAAQMAGRAVSAEFASTLLRKDGAPVEVVIHSNVATFGGQRATIGVILDISEHRRKEQRLREEEDKFRSLAEQNVAGIVIVRSDGTIGYCNGYFAHLIGCASVRSSTFRLNCSRPATMSGRWRSSRNG
jgi:PAS domain S-box-containing protein